MNSVNGSPFSAAPVRLWQVAILAAAGAIGTASQAEAAFYYYPDYSGASYYAPQQRYPAELRQKPQKRGSAAKKKDEALVEKETGAKPQGPLVIVVSIERQKVTIYDSNGVFAESPVSTGMKGHSTPMGVFSVIQKHKFHHSNIYSGAPMPYMQRITWSGVAMHAGVLPGYPASHGCIRMPMAFAVKMWNWTKMGARVIVSPGQMTPQSFSHPMLASLRVPPQPAASLEPTTSVGDKADKGAPDTRVTDAKPVETISFEKTASADGVLELRSTVGHTVMSDVTTGNAPVREEAAKTDPKSDEASEPAKQPETVSKTDDAAKPADAASTEAKPTDVADAPKTTSDEKPADKVEAAKSEQSEPAKVEAPKAEAVVDPVKSEPVKADTAETEKKPDAPVTATAPAQAASPDAKKDQTRVADPAPSVKPDLPKRTGQIAVFISRKDSKLYVRQNFAPLFDVPVTIAASDRPLGTHVFTAEVDKSDSNALHWSVVSLPVAVRAAARDEDGHVVRRQRGAAVIPVAAKPVITPDSPAEALDRITIPADAMAKINEMLTTGGSVIVSDQGINQGETGEGTDFIVRLY
ncbi:L,D-transpeptidase family protein [Bradyrhizobium sp. WYCCWR 13023]|uniref:L,D-transpeptidase family protein n=1 Tax=Bradyrhizobium zhengyangense TaxID=2911009 RepID=A0A9X1U9I5_9BRAD|nr:L,D-transpeptidase [Bradyrhizobium zhengyangense]MCG2630255.1 L,D-transpeptidase family protein [Bradyrhizobium zhengyangense]MCG2637782.1 L,D-transpeptidase family protein [Bradyrhizobium zhengyangense]